MQSQAGLLYLTSTFAFRALSDAGAIVRRIVLFSAAVACAVAQSPGTFIATGAVGLVGEPPVGGKVTVVKGVVGLPKASIAIAAPVESVSNGVPLAVA